MRAHRWGAKFRIGKGEAILHLYCKRCDALIVHRTSSTELIRVDFDTFPPDCDERVAKKLALSKSTR
jgi:hypothetical protein